MLDVHRADIEQETAIQYSKTKTFPKKLTISRSPIIPPDSYPVAMYVFLGREKIGG